MTPFPRSLRDLLTDLTTAAATAALTVACAVVGDILAADDDWAAWERELVRV